MKAHAAVEFAAYFMFFLALFLAALYVVVNEGLREVSLQRHALFQSVANNIASEFEFALVAGDGYQKNLSIPKTILGTSYELSFTPQRLVLAHDGSLYYAELPPSMGDPSLLAPARDRWIIDTSKGYVVIQNIKGVIYVSQ